MGSEEILRELASKASSYAINLGGKIERDATPFARGAHALVYRGTLHPHGRIVAVKTALHSDEEAIKQVAREALIASEMQHPNVLPLLGITTDFDLTISLVTVLMEGGDAHRYVRQRDRDPRPLVRDIARGLHYLHTHPTGPIIHGDLKGYNVLVSADGQAILTDFGYSELPNSSVTMIPKPPYGGTLKWKAPELIDTVSAQITVESDIWAFGMTVLELFTAKTPYPNLTGPLAIAARILREPPGRPSNEDTCSRMTDEWWDLCSRCLRMDPCLRARMWCVVEQIEQLKFPLSPRGFPMEAETKLTRPIQRDVTQSNRSNYNTFLDVPHQHAERASRYVSNLDDQIERGPSPYYRGARTLIYRGKLLSDGRTVAIKTPQGVGMDDEGIIKRILKEAYMGSKLKHPNILSILGITTRFDFTVSTVTPWMEGGNAHTYVQDPDIDPRPLIKDIALGLRYLHSHPNGPIIYRDLRGQNVLIASDGRAVLTDFGLSVLENSSFSMTVNRQFGGSLHWMAPEMVNTLSSQDPSFTLASDIWAFGMTALELFTRKLPYCNLTDLSSIQFRILKGPPERPSREDTCYRLTDEWWDLCSRCLRMDPSSRIRAEDVVKATRKLPPRNDIVIVVMGPARSGISNFVDKLAGCEGGPEADKLVPHAHGIRELTFDFPRGKRYVLVDTPGFANTYWRTQNILREVANWLHKKYPQDVKVTGVVYTQYNRSPHV